MILDPDDDPDHHQNLCPAPPKIPSKSIHNFLSNLED